ncbi:hypothetical protein ACGF5M_05115 [Gemmatimonadota bacterium]
MSTFEFISVLLSIVVGLALTRLLSGVGRALEIRRGLRFYWVQGVWVVNVGLLLVAFWWATLFSHVDQETWLFPNFALLLGYSVLLFLQAVLILPTDLAEGADLEAHFFEVRPWFFTLSALTAVAEFGDTFLHGGLGRVLEFGPYYLFIIISGVTLGAVGALTTNRRFHEVLCLAFFLSMTSWMIIRFWAIG